MKVIGIDLSGPANHKNTVMSVFQLRGNLLFFEKVINDASDEKILTAIQLISSQENVVIGIDAPLSYQDGGGIALKIKAYDSLSKGLVLKEVLLCRQR